LNNRHVRIVCAASAHVNVSVFYQPLTPPTGLGLLASPRGGFPRSGGAWLGRSQKDGLPSCCGGGGHMRRFKGLNCAAEKGAARSLPLSSRERDMDAKSSDPEGQHVGCPSLPAALPSGAFSMWMRVGGGRVIR